MLTINKEATALILTLDEVRNNPQRSAVVEAFIKFDSAKVCKPFAFKGDNGLVDKVELWAGDEIQQQAFVQRLKFELEHV